MNRFARLVLALTTAVVIIVGLAGFVVAGAQGSDDAPAHKAIGIIFCDDFESGDTAAWGSDDCSSTLDMPVAVTG